MKKFLFFFSLVLVVAALTLCACVASDTSETAQAYIQVRSQNQIVHPNLMPYYDFNGASYVPYSSLYSYTINGFYVSDSVSFVSSTNTPYSTAFGAHSTTFEPVESSNFGFTLVFDVPDIGRVSSFTVAFSSSNSNLFASATTCSVYDLTDGLLLSNVSAMPSTGTTGSPNTYLYYYNFTPNTSVNYSNHKFRIVCASSVTTGTGLASRFTMGCMKFECFTTTSSSTFPYFTGFVIPDFTYSLPSVDPDPDPSAEWDYIVRPNLLNGSDFYKYPYYTADMSPEHSMSDPDNVWFTNIPTSSFIYNEPLTGDLVGSTSFDLPLYPYRGYFVYRYLPSDTSLGVSDYTFTICLRSLDAGGYVLLSSSGEGQNNRVSFSASDDFQIISVSLSDVSLSDHVAILINFDDVTSDSTVSFAFSKLEQCSIFTGYVPPEHDISYWVRDNALTNYNFATVPSVMTGSNRVDNGVTDAWVSSYAFNFYYESGALVLDNSQNSDVAWLWYHFDVPTELVGEDFCFTLKVFCDTDFYIELTDFYRYLSSYPTVPQDGHIQVGYYQVSPAAYSLSMVGQLYEDFYAFIRVPIGSTMKLYAANLEQGENFTGFHPSFSRYYAEGYDVGYNAGYAEGVEVFASDTFTLPFENVEHPNSISVGWADMGFTNVESFAQSYFNLVSYFYEAKGFSVLSYGQGATYDTTLNRVVGMLIWISRDADVSDLSNATNYVYIAVREHSSTLVISDTEFPSDWNPVRYRDYRTVALTVSRGMNDILETYGDASYNNGKNVGYQSGYSAGYDQGKAAGFSLANEVQTNRGWLGFFSAFVDVPVMVLTSLLDFDFFGFNLFGLVRILIFVSLFYLVIRLITKGKVSS